MEIKNFSALLFFLSNFTNSHNFLICLRNIETKVGAITAKFQSQFDDLDLSLLLQDCVFLRKSNYVYI